MIDKSPLDIIESALFHADKAWAGKEESQHMVEQALAEAQKLRDEVKHLNMSIFSTKEALDEKALEVLKTFIGERINV